MTQFQGPNLALLLGKIESTVGYDAKDTDACRRYKLDFLEEKEFGEEYLLRRICGARQIIYLGQFGKIKALLTNLWLKY